MKLRKNNKNQWSHFMLFLQFILFLLHQSQKFVFLYNKVLHTMFAINETKIFNIFLNT